MAINDKNKQKWYKMKKALIALVMITIIIVAIDFAGHYVTELRHKSLIKELGDDNWQVRATAAEVLGEIGDERAIEPLINALGDGRPQVRANASIALNKFGEPAVEPLIKVLNNNNPMMRATAAEVLGEIGDERAVGPLIHALKDEELGVRGGAAKALGKMGAKRAVGPLIQALEDNAPVQEEAENALVRIGYPSVEPLIHVLEDDESDFQEKISEELSEAIGMNMNRDAEKLHPADVRKKAANILGKIGDERAVKPLIHVLEDKESDVRGGAAKALDELGWKPQNDAEKSYYLIAKMEWDELVKIGKSAIDPLTHVLIDEESQDIRMSIVKTLENLDWEPRRLPTGTFIVDNTNGAGFGELTIENGLNSDAIVVLSRDDWSSDNWSLFFGGRTILTSVYIRSKDSYTITDVPFGSYILYYAVGRDWDSDSEKFTITQTYRRFEEILSFTMYYEYDTVTYTKSYTVTLHSVSGGTAETESVSEANFPELS